MDKHPEPTPPSDPYTGPAVKVFDIVDPTEANEAVGFDLVDVLRRKTMQCPRDSPACPPGTLFA